MNASTEPAEKHVRLPGDDFLFFVFAQINTQVKRYSCVLAGMLEGNQPVH